MDGGVGTPPACLPHHHHAPGTTPHRPEVPFGARRGSRLIGILERLLCTARERRFGGGELWEAGVLSGRYASWRTRSSRRSYESCMPVSMPRGEDHVALFLGAVVDQDRHRRDPVVLVERHDVDGVGLGRWQHRDALEHLGENETVRSGDLPVFAVEADFHVSVMDDVAPLAADAQDDVADEPLGGAKSPPALDQFGCGVGLEVNSAGASKARVMR